MLAMSVWPLMGDCLAAPLLEIGLNNSYTSRTKMLNDRVLGVTRFISGNSYTQFMLGGRLSSWSRKSDISFLVCESKRRPCVACTLAMAPEQEEVGNEVSEVVSNTIDAGFISGNKGKDNENALTEGTGNQANGSGRGDDRRVDVLALAGSLQSAKTAEDIEEVLQYMEELPLPVYSSMIRGFGLDKRFESAIALFEWLKMKKDTTDGRIGPNLFIYNSLLGSMKQCKEFEDVEKIIEDMAEEGVIPNIITYNTLMAIRLEQGQPSEALTFLEVIQNKGLVPSPVSYSTALLAYRRMEDGSGALKFFVELRDKYQKGEIGKDDDGEDWEHEFVKYEQFIIRICYQIMRLCLVKGEQFSTKVLKLLAEMDKAGLKPGRAEYERLIWACTLEGHYIVAKELYTRIRERETGISLSVCNHVIWLMGKAKKWWAALEIYEDLLDKGPEPNNLSYELVVSHFNILLTAASRRGIWRWGVRLLNKMEEKGLKPRTKEWNAVLVACSKASETAAAVQIFRRMVEQGEKPTILSYGALLSALEKGKLYDEALQVWEHMIKLGIKPNSYAYTILSSIYIGQGKSEMVESVISEMVNSKIEPTVITYNAIISGCANNGMGGTAFEWFNRMKEKNITPNEITYEMLILGLARDAKPVIANEMYLKAQSEGLCLSSKAYDALVYSAQTFGATIDVAKLGSRPPEKKKNVKARKDLTAFCSLADVPRRSKAFVREELYTQDSE